MKKNLPASLSFHQTEWNDNSLFAQWGGRKDDFDYFLRKSSKNKKIYLCNLYMENGGDVSKVPFSWMVPYVSKELAKELVKLKQKYLSAEDRDETQPQSDYFKWPTTLANQGCEDLPESMWPKVGMLKAVGYMVGSSGVPQQERQEILKNVYVQNLPLIESRKYVSEWGEPQTSARLKKMANTLAALTRNAKRKEQNMSAAIKDWEHDLDWLKRKYYDQYCAEWKWPSIAP